jgi:hypothetical protein
MASILTLRPPLSGMARALNVDQRVGPRTDCPNDPADVEAVQRLVAVVARGYAATRGYPLPQPNGQFDPLTGFYIYNLQAQVSGRGQTGSIVDGVLSPARGAVYGAGVWTIIHLNAIAYTQSRMEWEELLRRYSGGR